MTDTAPRKPSSTANTSTWYEYATALGLKVWGYSKRNILEEVAKYEAEQKQAKK